MTAILALCWVDGGEADVVEADGQRAVVLSTRAAAPGQPLTARVAMASAAQVRLKVQGCKREADGRFRIQGRWLDLTRAMRDEIVTMARKLG
jgi:hypothetical protein